MKQIIVIDPGHNQQVLPAKQSPDGTLKEYAWNFEMAERLRNLLSSNGFDARLTITKTQSEDKVTKDSLTARANFANKICAEVGTSNVMFVSIHINAGVEGTKGSIKDKYGSWKPSNGWSIFVYGKTPNTILAGKESLKLANCLFDAVAALGFNMRKPLPNQKYWPGNFTVLSKTNCKAVLMENLFMDNKADCESLKSEDTKQKLLNAWYKGIMTYLGEPTTPKCECTCCAH